jgi:mutator protein MutT
MEEGIIRVVAAVIERRGRLLLCRRPAGKRHAGLWEFPGGKLLPGESIPDAARRELAEELAVEVISVGGRLFELRDPGSPFLVEFYPVEIAGEPVALEHEALIWARPEDLAGLDLAPSDRAFASGCLRAGKPAPDWP